MSKSILDASLSAALPDSLREDPTIAAVCEGIDPQVAAAARDAVSVMPWAGRLEVLPVAELDHIAWSFADHVWDQSWSDGQKRAYVGGILRRKKDLGTPARIAEAFSTLGYTAEVRDIMTHPAEYDPGRFAVYLFDQAIPLDQQWRLLYIMDQIKPASRWFEWVHVRRVEMAPAVGAGAYGRQIERLEFEFAEPVYEFATEPQQASAGGLAAVVWASPVMLMDIPKTTVLGGSMAIDEAGESRMYSVDSWIMEPGGIMQSLAAGLDGSAEPEGVVEVGAFSHVDTALVTTAAEADQISVSKTYTQNNAPEALTGAVAEGGKFTI